MFNYEISISFRYSIDRHTDLERYFSINPEDGYIKTIKPLDREEIAWHNISVFATEARKFSTEDFSSVIQVLYCSHCLYDIQQLK